MNAPFSPTGLHQLGSEEYHADTLAPRPSLSATLAKLIIGRSPLHAWTASPRLNPNWQPVEKRTFDIGRAAHRAALGRGGDYVAYPPELLGANGAASTKAAKEWAEEQRAAGRVPLHAEDVDAVGAMADAIHAHLARAGIALDPARSEIAALAEIDGVWCRCQVDNAPDAPVMLPGLGARKVLIDLKTCEMATPEACVRAVESYSYDVQQAHYLDVWKAATGEDREFIFAFVEKSAPHGVCIVHLLREPGHSGDWGQDAAEKAATARATWAECLRTDVWPGYWPGVVQAGANPYFRQRWQDQQNRAAMTRDASPAAIRRATAWQAPE